MQSLRCHFEKLDSAIYYSTLHYSLLKKKKKRKIYFEKLSLVSIC